MSQHETQHEQLTPIEPSFTPNDVDNIALALASKYGGILPAEMQLVLEAYDDDKLDCTEAITYFYLYDKSYDSQVPYRHDIVA